MRTIAKLFCTQIVRIFTFFVYFSIISTAMYRKIRVILLLYITKIRKYYKTKRGHIKKLTCPRIYKYNRVIILFLLEWLCFLLHILVC